MTKCQWAIPCQNEAKQGQYCDTHNRALGIKPEKVKKLTPIKKVSDKQKEKIKADKPRKDSISKFFAEMAAIMPNACQECGRELKSSMIINPRTPFAHILPKKLHPSIATETNNILFLCARHHNRFDSFSPVGMKVFELAKTRVQLLLPKIPQHELKHIPDYFL